MKKARDKYILRLFSEWEPVRFREHFDMYSTEEV